MCTSCVQGRVHTPGVALLARMAYGVHDARVMQDGCAYLLSCALSVGNEGSHSALAVEKAAVETSAGSRGGCMKQTGTCKNVLRVCLHKLGRPALTRRTTARTPACMQAPRFTWKNRS